MNGGVIERKDGRFVAWIHIDGKRIDRYAPTREGAEAKLAVLRQEKSETRDLSSSAQRLSTWIDFYLQDVCKDRVRPHTHEVYESRLRHIKSEIGSIRLRALTPQHIRRAYTAFQQRRPGKNKLSKSTVGAVHVTFKTCLSEAVRYGVIAVNPADAIRAPRAETPHRDHLSEEELCSLLEASAGTRWQALFAVMGIAGLRVGEATALHWQDITDDALHIRHTTSTGRGTGLFLGPPKTRRSAGEVQISPELQHMLRRHRAVVARMELAAEAWEPNTLVFPSESGRLLRTDVVALALKRACAQAGIRQITPHVLRHTAATLMLHHGVSYSVVQGTLRHASARTTLDLYMHATPDLYREAAAEMGQIVKRVTR
jgi:integrase